MIRNHVILDLEVSISSITTNGAAYDITFIDNPGDIPLLQVSAMSTDQDVFFEKTISNAILSNSVRKATTFYVTEKEKTDLSEFNESLLIINEIIYHLNNEQKFHNFKLKSKFLP